jgi:hypothetical protein
MVSRPKRTILEATRLVIWAHLVGYFYLFWHGLGHRMGSKSRSNSGAPPNPFICTQWAL